MEDTNARKTQIQMGKTVLGIELGSTRIKSVLLTEDIEVLAVGEYEWESSLTNGIWTYSLNEMWSGLARCYTELKKNIQKKYDIEVETVGAIGISAMMHGYMVFDKNGKLLVPFRTWRNTITEQASMDLTDLFKWQIPQRWSVAHLYQAILNEESHVKNIYFLTTLAGYVHWCLTGKKVLGIDDASGMFPINTEAKTYDTEMIEKFNRKVADKHFKWRIEEILPEPLLAGENAGFLTEKGALLLDPSGKLKSGVPMCPPEGDAGTGMVATNSIRKGTGNVSAGTSVFSMIVLDKKLSRVYPEIDIVTTPEGNEVAMVHCNNCTSDLNAWVHLFKECCDSFGMEIDIGELYERLYQKALQGDSDCGGLLSYNYLSGEHITQIAEGRPLFARNQNCKFNLANFMRTQLYAALSTLKMGNDLLLEKENVKVDVVWGHGGLFKTAEVGQRILAAALNTPVAVMKTAGEGGAWGIAVLAAYMLYKDKEQMLSDYLEYVVFKNIEYVKIFPDSKDVEGFKTYMKRYKSGLEIEQTAIKVMP